MNTIAFSPRVFSYLLYSCLFVAITAFAMSLHSVSIANDVGEHGKSDCVIQQEVVKSIIVLNQNLVTIDENGDLTDKKLAEERKKMISTLQTIQSDCHR